MNGKVVQPPRFPLGSVERRASVSPEFESAMAENKRKQEVNVVIMQS